MLGEDMADDDSHSKAGDSNPRPRHYECIWAAVCNLLSARKIRLNVAQMVIFVAFPLFALLLSRWTKHASVGSHLHL